ncbi:MAG: ATP-binding protein [Streptosporangiaceae bacterium]|jgi:two-component system sensor histidine kinase BaeS
MANGDRSGPIGLRLALAFVAVALSAVALVGLLTAVFTAADVSNLASGQRSELSQALGVAAADAWRHDHNMWSMTELQPVLDLASKIGAAVHVTDGGGRTVISSPGFTRGAGPLGQATAIMIGGHRAGTIQVRFGRVGLGSPYHSLRATLWQAVAGAAGIAALLALGVALVVSRRISKPVTRMIEVVRERGSGHQGARVGDLRAPAELRELAATFDTMADSMARQDRLRRNLVADVTHELRTPVAVLQAGHEALLDGVIAPTPGQLSSLRDEVTRLASMVDDLQILASAEAAALQLRVVPHDLAEIAEGAAASMASRFDAAEITLALKLAAAPVLADDRRMHQVITNLMSNAIKFTPAGGMVTIEVGQCAAQAVLTVSDTGVGLPAEELPFISERFWRGSNAAGVAGSGIGLAVVAELAWAHSGQLDMASAPGRGTRVTISLPLALPPGCRGPAGALPLRCRGPADALPLRCRGPAGAMVPGRERDGWWPLNGCARARGGDRPMTSTFGQLVLCDGDLRPCILPAGMARL